MTDRTVDDVSLHELARALYHVKHGNWGYDPGNPKHRKWFERAKAFAYAMGLSCEYRDNSDGSGSFPPQPTDRPSTKLVRIVGSWRRAPSPARDLGAPRRKAAAFTTGEDNER